VSRSVAPTSVNGPNWLDYGIAVMVASYLTVGALVASCRPRNAVGWLLGAVGLATADDLLFIYLKANHVARI
jgi:hypothetical protein